MKIVLDSSVFVAAFREEELFSREAFSVLQLLERGQLHVVVPVTVIFEVVAAIRRRTGSGELARKVGETILTFPTVSLIDVTTHRLGLMFDLASRSGLAGMDAIIVGVAQEFDIPLVTLDHEMAERAKNFVTIRTLTEILR